MSKPRRTAAARYRLSLTGTPLAADDMVHEAQTRLAFHIGLDWRCAKQPDSFADDIQSVRPPTRQAFFERWGCVCRVNSGNYTLDRCIDRSSLTNFLSPPSSTSTATVTFPTFCTMLYVTSR